MEIDALTQKVIHDINDLVKVQNEVVWNREQSKSLVERLQTLIPHLEEIKTNADPSQQPLVANIVHRTRKYKQLIELLPSMYASNHGEHQA